ncbi:phytanoyl-CoA dioxygenase family protein [Paracraurococcus ruber]|uniref:Phytanoyl-CoA dioxygenase n=1 Tax=Paracraurococcus ruber TaxID=77675 RepID=A0ABS1CXK2_9PROT|nr:phytanoyl-CoA dioxygenase family protein [Paracraurococcus ruber]MBK1659043.1 phytanoyl-CoA dioxygenase [Paracraurococcus ruber]TDG31303.1 phytanoyl-CoA dioxygenase [Paracraurococcus ruber]
MPASLPADAVAAYRDRGYHFPIRAFPGTEASRLLHQLRETEARLGGRLEGRMNQKPHLLFPWAHAVVTHPAVLDAVESVLGHDLLCWGSQFFMKGARDPAYVSWHQDGTYWGLSSPDVVTAWIAFTPSVPESGCMRVVPGTHRDAVPHADTFAKDNLLSRGQEVAVQVDEAQAVDIVLQPGEMSLHHVLIVHGSEPNRAAWPRIGFAIRYVPTHVRQLNGEKDSALLVRGADRFGHFEHETAPEAELHPQALARHQAILDRQLAILYRGAAGEGKLGASITR